MSIEIGLPSVARDWTGFRACPGPSSRRDLMVGRVDRTLTVALRRGHALHSRPQHAVQLGHQ